MAKLDKRTNGAIWLMAGPTALIVVSILLYAAVNWLLGSTGSDNNVIRSIMNILLFLAGVIGIISWLPGLIVGIVLLATKKDNAQN